MALVICCVFLTERMRRRMSIRLGMRLMPSAACSAMKRSLNSFSTLVDLAPSARRRCAFFSRICCRMPGMRVLDEAVQLRFERAALFDRQIVEEAVGAGEDDQDLLFDRQRLVLPLLQNLDQALRRGSAAAATPCRDRSRTARTPPARDTAPVRDAACRRPAASP